MNREAKTVDAAGTDAKAHRRPRGKRANSPSNTVTRETILTTALGMSRTIPLNELSVVVVAKEMDVTPALIHYYVNGRDNLTSGIMNLFYQEMLEQWPEWSTDWKVRIREIARAVFHKYRKYAGISAYSVSHSRFRTFQLVDDGATDYGVKVLEHYTKSVMDIDLPEDRSAVYAYMFWDFILSYAHSCSRHRFPSDHSEFIKDRVSALDPDIFPYIHRSSAVIQEVGAIDIFDRGCDLLLNALEHEIQAQAKA